MMHLRSNLRGLLGGAALLVHAASTVGAQKSVTGMIGKDVEHVARDIWAVWTSPFDAHPQDLLAGIFFIGSTAAISPIDDDVDRWAVRNQNARVFDALDVLRNGGKLYDGSALAPVAGAVYVAGLITKQQSVRDAITGCGATWGANNVMRKVLIYRVIGRERPDPTRGENPPPPAQPGDQYHVKVPGGDWGWQSFPGGHFANILGCASFFNHRFHWGFMEPVVYAFAGAIALSRTIDRAHWTSDQWLGGVFGYAIGKEVAHRQLQREADRVAAGAGSAVTMQPVSADGVFITRTGDVTRFGWQRRF